jgi:hypothetical protein
MRTQEEGPFVRGGAPPRISGGGARHTVRNGVVSEGICMPMTQAGAGVWRGVCLGRSPGAISWAVQANSKAAGRRCGRQRPKQCTAAATASHTIHFYVTMRLSQAVRAPCWGAIAPQKTRLRPTRLAVLQGAMDAPRDATEADNVQLAAMLANQKRYASHAGTLAPTAAPSEAPLTPLLRAGS